MSDRPETPPAICYFDAFFSREEMDASNPFALAAEAEAAAYHEAGHAVIGYLLGFGISQVSVVVTCCPVDGDPSKLGYAFSGRYEGAKRAAAQASREIKRRGYGQAALNYGILTCAGPAAELRYRRETGLPLHLLGATDGDHELVDKVAKHLDRGGRPVATFRPRSGSAYRRLVWREALKAAYRPDVWDARTEKLTSADVGGDPEARERRAQRRSSSRSAA
jgi:hypothetical protein